MHVTSLLEDQNKLVSIHFANGLHLLVSNTMVIVTGGSKTEMLFTDVVQDASNRPCAYLRFTNAEAEAPAESPDLDPVAVAG